MTNKNNRNCYVCFYSGAAFAFAGLFFSLAIDVVPMLGFASASPFWQRVSAYVLALVILYFLVSAFMTRLMNYIGEQAS